MRRVGTCSIAAAALWAACTPTSEPPEARAAGGLQDVAPAAPQPPPVVLAAPTVTGVWEDWSTRTVTIQLETFRPAREFVVNVVVDGKRESSAPTFVAPAGPTHFDAALTVLRGSKVSEVGIAADDEVPEPVLLALTETLLDAGIVPSIAVRTGAAVAKLPAPPPQPTDERPPRSSDLPRALPGLMRQSKDAPPAR